MLAKTKARAFNMKITKQQLKRLIKEQMGVSGILDRQRELDAMSGGRNRRLRPGMDSGSDVGMPRGLQRDPEASIEQTAGSVEERLEALETAVTNLREIIEDLRMEAEYGPNYWKL